MLVYSVRKFSLDLNIAVLMQLRPLWLAGGMHKAIQVVLCLVWFVQKVHCGVQKGGAEGIKFFVPKTTKACQNHTQFILATVPRTMAVCLQQKFNRMKFSFSLQLLPETGLLWPLKKLARTKPILSMFLCGVM